MASHTSNSFVDGELSCYLPDATVVYDIEQSNDIPASTPHVDWAWDEPSMHFLCEIKDPESKYALDDEDGVASILRRIDEGSYLVHLAEKAYQTTQHHTPSKHGTKVYVALIAIESLTGAELDIAGLGITRALRLSSASFPAVAVNIARWNETLSPRTIERV